MDGIVVDQLSLHFHLINSRVFLFFFSVCSVVAADDVVPTFSLLLLLFFLCAVYVRTRTIWKKQKTSHKSLFNSIYVSEFDSPNVQCGKRSGIFFSVMNQFLFMRVMMMMMAEGKKTWIRNFCRYHNLRDTRVESRSAFISRFVKLIIVHTWAQQSVKLSNQPCSFRTCNSSSIVRRNFRLNFFFMYTLALSYRFLYGSEGDSDFWTRHSHGSGDHGDFGAEKLKLAKQQEEIQC